MKIKGSLTDELRREYLGDQRFHAAVVAVEEAFRASRAGKKTETAILVVDAVRHVYRNETLDQLQGRLAALEALVVERRIP